MNSTPNPQTSMPDDALAARADERLAHAYEQIARADEQLARVTEQLSRLENGARHPSVIGGWRPSRGRPLLRGFIGVVLAAGICAAAFAAQTPYGETARQVIAQWVPGVISASMLPAAKPGDSSVQLAASETTPSREAPPPQAPAQDAAPTPAPLPPELTQLLQTMAHDIAVVEQEIEQLKASQERMFADNAAAIEQLKASQEQLTRVAARPPENKPLQRPSEQDPRARTTPATTAATTPASSPRTVANATRKPPPAQPPQARARSQPIQLQPEEQ